MRFFYPIAITILCAIASLGCSDDPGPLGCVPGQIIECPCLGGTTGVQTCKDDGNSYGECSCNLPPTTDIVVSDTNEETDIQEQEDVVSLDTASEDIAPDTSSIDQVAPPPEDIEDDLSEEDVATGLTMLGCDGETYELPLGYADATISPSATSLVSDMANPATQQFVFNAITESGNEIPVDTALFTLSNPDLGVISSNGLFTSTPGMGGETKVRGTWLGICVEADLSVIATSHVVTGSADPAIIDLFPTETPTASDEEDMLLLYPLHEAAWPGNLAPMTVQWLHNLNWAGMHFRVDIETDFTQIHIYTTAPDATVNVGAYALPIPQETWESIWEMGGGNPPHRIRVASINEDGSESHATQAHDVIFTTDQVGGAVYYWNNDQETNSADSGRIRMLAMDEIEPLTVDIDAGCHGCHGISPDGSVVAATVQLGGFDTEGLAEGWSMGLFSTEDGSQSDWIHEDAQSFLFQPYTLNPAFSKFYWTDSTRHMVVAQGGDLMKPALPGEEPSEAGGRHLYSVDLFNGLVTQLTGLTDPDENWVDMYPSFSSNGDFLIFMRTQTPGLFGAVDESFLYRMPYNAGLGGDAYPLVGADTEDVLQYYPSLTPDDAFVVFNRVEAVDEEDACAEGIGPGKGGIGSSYNNCLSEVWMVSVDGGDPVRLDRGSGPPGEGLTNSWPSVAPMENTDFYWIAFSSYRPYGVLMNSGPLDDGPSVLPKPLPSEAAVPQLWIIGVDPNKIGTGEDPSYSPIWLPNQDQGGGNHIGQWSVRSDDE